MSDVFGEARIRIIPDLTGFSQKLDAEVTAATRLSSAQGRLAGASTAAVRGAKNLADQSKKTSGALLGAGSASARLDAALLGLRTAAGSAAVIGLSATALAAIAAGKAFRQMIIDTASFEQELSTFQATTGATAEQMTAVSAAAEKLGADITLPGVSASDAAVAMTELAKAGLSVEDALAGSVGVLQLATAAQISNAEAAQISANALNAFGLSGNQAVEVADDLANAANAAQGSISDFGQALAQSSAVARQVGLSLADTTALLSLFAKNGLQGSDAGTSLRVALIRLVAPTKQAADEIQKLGLHIRDAQGNLRPDVFAQFGDATRDLTPAARDAAAALIFGQDAIRAVSIGAREGAEGLRLMQFQIDQSGTAADLAAARTTGLAGAFGALQSNAQTTGVEIGQKLTRPLIALADALNDVVTATSFAIDALAGLQEKVGKFFLSFPGAKSEKSFADRILGVSGIDIANAGLNLVGLGKSADKAKVEITNLEDELQGLQKARVAAEQGGESKLADQLTTRIKALKQQLKDLNQAAAGIGAGPAGVAINRLKASLAELVKVKKIEIATGTSTTQTEAEITRLKNRIKELTAAGGGARVAGRDLAGGLGELSAAARGVTSSFNQATNALAATGAQMKALNRESSALDAQLLKLQTEGGTPQQQVGVLRQDIAVQRQKIAEAQAHGNQPGDATAITSARNKIRSDQAQIDSIQAEIDSENQAATQKAQDAARTAAEQADKQTQAFIDQFGDSRQKRINRAKLAASLTEGVQDDLNVDRQIKRFLRDKIRAIQERIRNLHLHGAALRTAQDAIRQALDDITDINNQIAQDIATRSQQRLDSIQLDIDLAQTNNNVRREITLRKKLIAALIEAQSHVKKNTLEWKRLRNRIAEETQAIKDLQKQQEKKNDASSSAAAQFAFLQTQTGFAANLLGNLIPLGATGGLVGGTTATAAGTTPLRQVPGGFEQPRGANAAQSISAQAAAAPSGPSRTGQARQTHLLNQILHVLNNIYRGTGHPEAHHRRRTNPSAMDLDNHH